MGGLGGQQLGAQVPGLLVGGAALACFSELELGVCWEEALVVGWTAEGLFAACLLVVSQYCYVRAQPMIG